MNRFRIEKEGDFFHFREMATGNIIGRFNPEAGRIISYLPGEGNLVWFMNERGDTLGYDVVAKKKTALIPAGKIARDDVKPQSSPTKIVATAGMEGRAGSWFGGRPSLPNHIEWPRSGKYSYLFIGQINCEQLPDTLWGGIGPRSGWLAVFASQHEGLAARVLYFPKPGRENLPPGDIFHENMMYERIGQEPPFKSVGFAKVGESAKQSVESTTVGKIFGRRNNMNEIDEDIGRLDVEPAYFTSGYQCEDSMAVLLELPSSDFFGWQWGDVDNLTVVISRDRLEKCDFSELRCELSCEV